MWRNFITEQVGAENDRELVELLLGKTELPFPEQYLDIVKKRFCDVGFDILDGQECFRPIKFFDIGALVWFAHIIEWEFPNFSVDNCKNRLLYAQQILEKMVVLKEKFIVFIGTTQGEIKIDYKKTRAKMCRSIFALVSLIL